MPDFTARWTTPSVTVSFEDELGDPPRLNPRAGKPHRRLEVGLSAFGFGGAVVAQATVGGVEGEVDAILGARLFTWDWVQWPGYPAKPSSLPVITNPAGQSSVANTDVSLWSLLTGLWVLSCRRVDGGAVLLPLTTRLV